MRIEGGRQSSHQGLWERLAWGWDIRRQQLTERRQRDVTPRYNPHRVERRGVGWGGNGRHSWKGGRRAREDQAGDFGDRLRRTKGDHTLRVAFQNINSLPRFRSGYKNRRIFDFSSKYHLDIIGLVETNRC